VGHFLETMNPDAVDQIGGTEADDMPGIGEWVVYHGRPGEGRRGKNTFPALVMDVAETGDAVTLMVAYDVDDWLYLERLPQRTANHQWPAWSHRKALQGATPNPGRLDDVRKGLEDLRHELVALRTMIFGEWKAPPKAIMDYLADFEKRLKSVTVAANTPAVPAAKKKRGK
jgi:hypothetical protein